MPNPKARPIFSPRQIAKAVELIKQERPELWALWRKLESSASVGGPPAGDEGVNLIGDVQKLLRKLNITENLTELTALIWAVRKTLRTELGLWAGVKFNSDKIITAIDTIKLCDPVLWNAWKKCEHDGESYHHLRERLKKILLSLDFVEEGVAVSDLLSEIRNVVLVEAGIWAVTDIKL